MKITRPTRATLAAITAAATVASSPMAWAHQTCFTAFGGTVNYQFDGKLTKPGYHPLTGVTFGSLSSCAGLTHWGVMGSAYTESGSIVMGFRAETADASNCGAVDFTVSLNPSTLTGPLQLYNDRTNFGNSDTLTEATCVTVPPAAPAHRSNGKDVNGN